MASRIFTRATYIGSFNELTPAGFTVPAGESWLIQSLVSRITLPGTSTQLIIQQRLASSVTVAAWHEDGAPAAQAQMGKRKLASNAVMIEDDRVFLKGGTGTTEIELILSYIRFVF